MLRLHCPAEAILQTTTLTTPLQGLLIGNGWIDPYSQYPAYLTFALKSKLLKPNSDAEVKIRALVDECMKGLDARGGRDAVKVHEGNCESILSAITDSTIQSYVSLY